MLGNGWILVGHQLAHNSAKSFLCGYTSCKLPDNNFFEQIAEDLIVLKHPDNIPIMEYWHGNGRHHDGGLFNEALLREDEALIDKDAWRTN